MTTAELLAAAGTALTAAFEAPWSVWSQTPDATAVPAVWPQLSTGSGGPSPRTGSSTTVTIVAAIAPQTAPAEEARKCDAIDRCDTLAAFVFGCAITSRQWFVDQVDIGGVPHTAVKYSITFDRPADC